jgi:outer membrane beta-barrel protein
MNLNRSGPNFARNVAFFVAVVASSVSALPAYAENGEPEPTQKKFESELAQQAETVPVTQNRQFDLHNELAFAVGGLPLDRYYKGLTVGAGYTWHFLPDFGWEIVNFTYSFNFDSHLKEQVLTLAVARPGQPLLFPEINWIAATHIVVRPLYGKEALFNTRVTHVEAFVLAGPAFLRWSDPAAHYAIGIDLGAGLRLHLTQVTSVRLDLGDVVYTVNKSPKQALRLSAAVAFNLGAGP